VHHLEPYRTFRTASGDVDWSQANQLANLVTLCRPCHAAAERTVSTGSALGGLAYALQHVASLHLMCDPRDLGVSAEARAPWSKAPTVAAYERAGASGFGRALFGMHEELLAGVRALVASCPCRDGCPSCVGAPPDYEGAGRAGTLAVLEMLGA
jgi:DEAD/DEAH box helicase domain-containing protein